MARQSIAVSPTRHELIDSFASLAHHLVRRYQHWSLDQEDFFQEAMLAAIRAIDDFRVDRKVPLGADVTHKIRWAIGHQLERANRQAQTSGPRYHDRADVAGDDDDIQDELWDAVEALPARDQAILIGFFGLDAKGAKTRAQLGARRRVQRHDGLEINDQVNQPAEDSSTGMRRPPRLVPMFPILSYVPLSPCPHYRPIRRGSVFVCAVCWRSGYDHWAYFHRDPATDPQPEPKPRRRRGPVKAKTLETRRQRRLRQFGPPQ